jgi:type III restriction enzyme
VRFALKDYQVDAVGDVLRNLADARDDWHRKQRPVAFSLTATTGAGKTVMAAAVIEALFDGDADTTSRRTRVRSCCGSPTTRH